MSKQILFFLFSAALFIVACSSQGKKEMAQLGDGDIDGDGVADEVDQDPFDSCMVLTPPGARLGNCATGIGDGVPEVTPFTLALEADFDQDGVPYGMDVCPGTSKYEVVPVSGELRGKRVGDEYLSFDGCNCSQILDRKPGGNHHMYIFGCTEITIRYWNEERGWAKRWKTKLQ